MKMLYVKDENCRLGERKYSPPLAKHSPLSDLSR